MDSLPGVAAPDGALTPGYILEPLRGSSFAITGFWVGPGGPGPRSRAAARFSDDYSFGWNLFPQGFNWPNSSPNNRRSFPRNRGCHRHIPRS